ncbi:MULTISPECIES: helix-turn-helix transcriptional regulator [unclassified Agrococcus]|uniref:helix-turn-helix transcriptional regulator n=1 Tax=unclassified Agrococcus TaxID=2615065 RepID=UPI00361C7B5C
MLFDVTDSRVGASLRRLRELAGMTQHELADAVGVGTEHLDAVETGAVLPSTAFLSAASAALALRLREQPPGPGSRQT